MSEEHVATEEQVKETTEKLIADAQQNIKPEEAAGMVFKYYWPQYKLLVSKLSNKDARRLNEAVVGFPLEVTDKNFFSTDAKEAFKLAKTLIDAKFILQQKVIGDAINALENKGEDTAVVSSSNNETVIEGEKTNG